MPPDTDFSRNESSESSITGLFTPSTGRDPLQTLLTLACISALVLTLIAAPTVSSDGGVGTGNGSGGSSGAGPAESASSSQARSSALSDGGLGSSALTNPLNEGQTGGVLNSLGQLVNGSSPGESSSEAGGINEFGALNHGQQTSVGSRTPLSTGNSSSAAGPRQAAIPHFRVESDDPAYWRTNAYDVYTGETWKRTSTQRDVARTISTPRHPAGEVTTARFTLQKSAASPPTVWRPTGTTLTGAEISAAHNLRTERVSAGTVYRVSSYRPPRNASVLRRAGDDYPDSVREHYTRLPESVSEDRIRELTGTLTRSGGSQYAKVKASEHWLETHKQYSLNVTRPDGDVATEFLFNMDKGYCEYFASSMAVMLRSQDIPARYVIGYSPGHQVDQNTYQVHSMNAHAWVEVYFPDVGWVRFDPTPARERIQTETKVYQGSHGEPANRSAGDYNPTPPSQLTNDTPTVSPPGDDAQNTTDSQPSNRSTDDPQTDYSVTVHPQDPAPGTTAVVHVEQDGIPASGVTVAVNGDVVGETNTTGDIGVTVPYTDTLRVTVREPATTDTQQAVMHSAPGDMTPERAYSLERPPSTVWTATGPQNTSTNTSNPDATVNVTENMTFSRTGLLLSGNDVTYHVEIKDTPVRNAAVYLGDEQVTTTSNTGNFTVTLPESAQDGDTIHLEVKRGAINDSTTETVEPVSVSVTSTSWIPVVIPGRNANITVTVGDQPVQGATVSVAGETVGETNQAGVVTISVPLQPKLSLTATHNAFSTQTTVWKPLWGVLLLVFGIGGGLVGASFLAYRYNLTPRRIAALAAKAMRGIARRVTTAMVALGRYLAHLGRRIRDLGIYLRENLYTLQTVGKDVKHWVLTAPSRFTSWVAEVWLRLKHWAYARLPWRDKDTLADLPADDDSPNESVGVQQLSIRKAWRQLISATGLQRWRTMTPGEIAATATEKGLPEGPVTTLTEAFREVEYGNRDPDSHLDRVTKAAQRITPGNNDSAETSSDTDTTVATDRGADS
ncbi:transglutaminaseTgpA domain-containing protein [Salinibaculum rarum]|uniref:transglutaminaseTgpA domain-containing protein n=1 Tax=Salinibaculum rarum TaxID=3058903 RepID=UPI00265E2FB2|nr:transglutaminaseTgpA domain-containing protein [Salinibaculum sp. KK48]